MTPKFHKLEIDINIAGMGSVKLDGKPLACRDFVIGSKFGDKTEVWLSVLADDVKISLETDELTNTRKPLPVGSDGLIDITSTQSGGYMQKLRAPVGESKQ